MNSEDLPSVEIPISPNNVLSKVEKKNARMRPRYQQYRYPQNRKCNYILLLKFGSNQILTNYIWIKYYIGIVIGLANGPGSRGSIPPRVLRKTKKKKMVLDAALLNTQHYKVRNEGEVEQSREWSSALPLHLSVKAFEKEAFGSPTLD